MKVLVSGGAGFIGSHVVEKLLDAGHVVWVVDDLTTGNNELPEKFYKTGEFWEIDILSKYTLMHAFDFFKPDAVIHLAAQASIVESIADPERDMQVNGIGTLNIIQNCIEFGVKRLIFSSTSAVYASSLGDVSIHERARLSPESPYGISKLCAELYLRSMFPSTVVLRFGNVYGPRQVPIGNNQVIARMIRHLEYGDPFEIFGSGAQTRDFVYVDDVVDAILASLGGEPGTYNIATNLDASVNVIAKAVALEYGFPEYPWKHTSDEDPRQSIRLDVSEAQRGLGWEYKTNLANGIHNTVNWWKENKQ